MENSLITLDAESISTMYSSSFTKKQSIQTGIDLVNQVNIEGLIDPLKVFSSIVRLKEVVNAADKAFRDTLDLSQPETANGVSFKQNNGSQRLNYSDDQDYAELEAKLAERKELLSLAFKSKDTIFDSNGVEVPKVSCTFTKASIVVTF